MPTICVMSVAGRKLVLHLMVFTLTSLGHRMVSCLVYSTLTGVKSPRPYVNLLKTVVIYGTWWKPRN